MSNELCTEAKHTPEGEQDAQTHRCTKMELKKYRELDNRTEMGAEKVC